MEAYARHLMVGSCGGALAAMRAGLCEMVPAASLAALTAEDAAVMLAGAGGAEIDLEVRDSNPGHTSSRLRAEI